MFRNFRVLTVFGLLLLFMSGLAGCSLLESLVKIEQEAITGKILLLPGATVGQTLVARYDGLQSFSIFLEPQPNGDGRILLNLFPDPTSKNVLASGSIELSDVRQADYYTIPIRVILDTTGTYYYLQLETLGAGAVQIGVAGGDTYLNGALYQDGIPQDAQMAFRLGYEPGWALRGLAKEGATWLGFLLVGLVLFVLPGWALLAWLLPGWDELHWGARLGLGSGISLAIYPLLILWTRLVGLQLGPLYAWLPALGGLLALAWRNRRYLDPKTRKVLIFNLSGLVHLGTSRLWPNLALLGIIGLIFLVRFWAVRGLEAPMWGDSYLHTMITQLIIDNKGLFDTWLPYAELQSFTYHFGFHSLAAVFHWVTGLPAHLAVLWTGQLLNGLAVISLLPLVLRWQRSLWASLIVLLLAGLLVPMPMYYTNWGRYTQLTGQVILPVAIFLIQDFLESTTKTRRVLILTWLILAGLALNHYRVLLFALCFFPAIFLFPSQAGKIRSTFLRSIQIGTGALVLFLPWLVHSLGSKLASNYMERITTLPSQANDFLWQYNSLGDLSPFLPNSLWLLLVLAAGWGLWRNKRPIALVVTWWGMIMLITNPQWLNLPGMGVITNFAVLIATYIPAGLILGSALGEGIEALSPGIPGVLANPKKTAWLSASLACLLLITGLLGARQRLWDIDPPSHVLVTRPDLHAAAWIQTNLPEESLFLVNSFSAYSGSVVVGSDAGWWLPVLAHRKTTLPPISYENETGFDLDYELWNEAWIAETSQKGLDHPDVIAMLHQIGITHIYIGQRQGQVNTSYFPLLLPQLLASPLYAQVYHQDRVWIFALQEP